MVTSARQVYFHWAFDQNGERIDSTQALAVPFWPTAADFIDGKLYVAGRPPQNARTRIERWTITFPPPPTTPTDYAVSISKKVIYDEGSPTGQTTVRFLRQIKGASGKALVQFAESNDVFELDLITGARALIVSARAYYTKSGGPRVDPVVLLDVDKNGTIDTWSEMTPVEFDAALGSPRDWIDVR